MSRLLQLAQDVREGFRCNCTDTNGGDLDPEECECGGDGAGQRIDDEGCWHCQAVAAIHEATGRAAPSSEAPVGAVELREWQGSNDMVTWVNIGPTVDMQTTPYRYVRAAAPPVSPQGDGPRAPPEAARKVESAADMYKRLGWPEPSDAKKWANLDYNLRASRRVVVPPVFPRPRGGPRVADVWRGTWDDALDWHLLQPEGDGWMALAECGRRRHVFKDSDFTDGTLTFVRRGDKKPQGKA